MRNFTYVDSGGFPHWSSIVSNDGLHLIDFNQGEDDNGLFSDVIELSVRSEEGKIIFTLREARDSEEKTVNIMPDVARHLAKLLTELADKVDNGQLHSTVQS